MGAGIEGQLPSPRMDCRTFRRLHLEFVDDSLPGDLAVIMREHADTCSRCSFVDVRVRRSLMLVRSQPDILLTPSFGERLRRRLEIEGRSPPVPSMTRNGRRETDVGFGRKAALR